MPSGQLEAFAVEFKMYVFAHSGAEAAERLRVFRSLATAAGHDPGSGRTTQVSVAQLARDARLTGELERARAKDVSPAGERQRERAVAGLASHLAGDIDLAREVVNSIETVSGPLSNHVARAFEDGRRPAQAVETANREQAA